MFKGKSIADVLDMTVEEGVEFFAAVPAVRDKLETLKQVGLGYIQVGQQANDAVGRRGAARQARQGTVAQAPPASTLYILDEPTTGLHFHDVAKLLEVLHELVDQGNTVVVIEHNLEVIKTADWMLDLGPEGGDGGGEIVAAGRRRTSSPSRAAIPASSSRNCWSAVPAASARRPNRLPHSVGCELFSAAADAGLPTGLKIFQWL